MRNYNTTENGSVRLLQHKSDGVKKFLKNNYTGWLFNLPLTIGLLAFTVIPVGYSLYISFWRTNCINIWEWRGFANYVRMFTIDRTEMGKVLLNTFYYVIVSVPLGLVVSYLLAALVNNTIVKGVKAYRILYYLPCMIPAVAAALLWADMMRYTASNQTMGVLNRILVALGAKPSRWLLSEGPEAIASLFFINLWGSGGGMLLWLSAFKNIDKGLYEAADIEGASRLKKFFLITIPMSTPMIFYNLIMSMIGSIQFTGTMLYSGGPYPGRGTEDSLYMLGMKIYNTSFKIGGAQGYAAALAWFMLAIIGAITVVLFLTSKWVFYGEEAQ
ncbi:MAG: sugar ABC transporter permease [Clostridia bacterium]|nr:sugar ABC transporter permease [Clostridia bacterium]